MSGFRILCSVLLYFQTFVFGISPLIFRSNPEKLTILNCMSAGFFLAGGLLHMLPESQEQLEGLGHPNPAFFLCALGILIVLFVERVAFHGHGHGHGHHAPLQDLDASPSSPEGAMADEHFHSFRITGCLPSVQGRAFIPMLLALVLSIHAIVAGMALGVQKDMASGAPILIAIVSHKWVEAISLGVSCVKNGQGKKQIIRILSIFSLMTPIGVLLGWGLESATEGENEKRLTGTLTAVASGTFLYVSLLEVLAEEFGHGQQAASKQTQMKKACAVVIGFAGMALLLSLFHAPHDHQNHRSAVNLSADMGSARSQSTTSMRK